MNWRIAGCVGIVMCLLGIASFADDKKPNEDGNTRSVQGVVTDAAGNPVADAVVQLKDTKSLGIRSYRTGADGSYHFAGLSTNEEYQIKADHDGETSGKKTLTVFDGHKTATINLKLKK